MGAKAYKLVRDLSTPDAPTAKTYEELCNMLTLHYTPPVIAFKERKMFYKATKLNEETSMEWIARLKLLASACGFGNRIQDILLDKYVTGLDGRIFDRLCEEDHNTLTLKRALELSAKWEIQNKIQTTSHRPEEGSMSPLRLQESHSSVRQSVIDVVRLVIWQVSASRGRFIK